MLIKLTITPWTNTLPQALGPKLILVRTESAGHSASNSLSVILQGFKLVDSLQVASFGRVSILRFGFMASLTTICDPWTLS